MLLPVALMLSLGSGAALAPGAFFGQDAVRSEAHVTAPGPRRVAAAKDKAWKKQIDEIKTHYLLGQLDQVLVKVEAAKKKDLTGPQTIQLLRYQAFTLFLMKSKDVAADVWREILAIDPNYRLNVDEVSPEFLEFFRNIHPPHVHKPGETHDHDHGHDDHGHDAAPEDGTKEGTNDPTKEAPQETPPPGDKETGTEVIQAQPDASSKPSLAAPPPTLEADDVRGCGIVLCLVPGGVGQYANDQIVKGVIFSVLQAAALGLNLGMYWGPSIGDPEAQVMVQRVSLISLFALVGIGIADAFLFY